MSPRFVELSCQSCGERSLCDQTQTHARLQEIGLLRRAENPSWELMLELMASAAARLPCRECDALGLTAQLAIEEEESWDDARMCLDCGAAIQAERIEVFPETKLCAACQKKDESAESREEPDYCPKCGALMTVRQSGRGGITRYVSVCTECRR